MPESPSRYPAAPASGRLMRFAGALSETQFFRYVSTTFLWGMGYQLLTLAQGYTLFSLTESTLYLAAQGAATGIPQLLVPAFGGFLNDRVSRKALLITGSVTMAIVMLGVTIIYAAGALRPWHILVAGAFQGGLLGLDWTTRQSMLPAVVSRPRLVSAVSIDLTAFNLARIVAPLAGGVVLASFGGPTTYGLIAGLLATNALVALSLRPAVTVARQTHPAIWSDARELARAIASDSVIGLNVAFTGVNALMLGALVYLMPAYADEIVQVGETGLSSLFASLGLGAFVASGVLAISSGLRRAGLGLILSNLLFAGFSCGFALAGSLGWALAVLWVASFFNNIHISLGASAIQIAAPEEVRGRIFGAYEVAWGLFPLGGLVFGAVASLADLRFALISAAGMTAAFTGLVWVLSPRIRGLAFARK